MVKEFSQQKLDQDYGEKWCVLQQGLGGPIEKNEGDTDRLEKEFILCGLGKLVPWGSAISWETWLHNYPTQHEMELIIQFHVILPLPTEHD